MIKDALGNRLGEFDGRYTRKRNGEKIGEGNLLVLFLKDYIRL